MTLANEIPIKGYTPLFDREKFDRTMDRLHKEPYDETFDEFVEALIASGILVGNDKMLCANLLSQWRKNKER